MNFNFSWGNLIVQCFIPIMTDVEAAPKNLLKFVREAVIKNPHVELTCAHVIKIE